MNIILYFAILGVCAIHVHSMKNEAPSLNDLLFFNGLMQKPQQIQAENKIDVQPEALLEAENGVDLTDILRDLFPSHEEQNVEKAAASPFSNADSYTEMLNKQTPEQQKQMVEPEDMYILQLPSDFFSQKQQRVEAIPKTDIKSESRDSISALEKQTVKQETKATQTEDTIDLTKEMPKVLSELFDDLLSQTESSVNVAPKPSVTTSREADSSRLLRELFSGQKEQVMELVPRDSAFESQNDMDISNFLQNFVSSQNEKVKDVVPMISPKIDNESEIPDIFFEIIPSPKEPETPVMIEINDRTMNNLATEMEKASTMDETKQNTPEPNINIKVNELFSDVINPLEQRLLNEFERALVPLNDIIELGANIKNSPFTEKEIKKLGLFTVYMQTTQELYSEFKSEINSFGANRFPQSFVPSYYYLSKNQKKHTLIVLNDVTEIVKRESKAIYDLILNSKNQQLIKSIENKKLELSASLRAISLALMANNAHLIDDDKMLEVKTKHLSIIEETSKSMIEILQSKTLENLKDGIVGHVDKLINIMNKLPMKLTLSYMF